MFRDVPGCSGMFRNVPACSGMFHVPGFIDAPWKVVAQALKFPVQTKIQMDSLPTFEGKA